MFNDKSLFVLGCVFLSCVLWRIWRHIRPSKRVVAFFHPFCNAGGGGERVLWVAVASIQHDHPNLPIVIYTGDAGVPKTDILERASVGAYSSMDHPKKTRDKQQRFGIVVNPDNLTFVYLQHRRLVEEATWPRFTLLGQSLGSMVLALEALYHCSPAYFVDTMGYAFTYPLVRLLSRASIISYTHYPIISPDMIWRVQNRQPGHTNAAHVAASPLRSVAKLFYYRLLARLYKRCLLSSDQLLTNSTWTRDKIQSLLGKSSRKEVQIVYPPCDVKSLAGLPLMPREPVIFSLAQFRPEKEHKTQIKAMALFTQRFPKEAAGVTLVLAGSVRNKEDEDRVQSLKELVAELRLQDCVRFVVNASYQELLPYFKTASIGLSTMIDEHFGINVVELMAAGILVVAHPSAGPLYDILVPFDGAPTGFHADTPDDFSERLAEVFRLPAETQEAMRGNARVSVQHRFSEEIFVRGFLAAFAAA